MREILLTSSVLILALLLLRRIFWERISRRIQYALWGLVLIRLLVPVSLPALDFSVLAVTEPVHESISARLEAPAFTGPVIPLSEPQLQFSDIPASGTVVQTGQDLSEHTENTSLKRNLTDTLRIVWLTGAVLMTVWLIVSNLCFLLWLRRNRVSINIPNCKLRVYMVESKLTSPCLFGLLRPAIYLTPSAADSEERLRHVLAHEETHARHLDLLWALLGNICLSIYWFDPLVWIAVSVSKTDCELACDEGAVRCLGEEERLAYGKTLLHLIPVRKLPGNPLLSATTMSSGKKRLRERINRIAENRKTCKLALCVAALLTAAVCLVTFAGVTAKPTENRPLTAAELQYFNEYFFNAEGPGEYFFGEYINFHNQFLSSMYSNPKDINLLELFCCGTEEKEPVSEEERKALKSANDFFANCDITKISAYSADQALLNNTGLTLSETNQTGLENFIYLPEYDAYYLGHGDSNYCSAIFFSAGERIDCTVRLYYEDTYRNDGWKCAALRETEDGGYQFLSNTYCEKPAAPTEYPAGEALLTIPLTDLPPCGPQRMDQLQSGDPYARLLDLDGDGAKELLCWDGPYNAHLLFRRDGDLYEADITALLKEAMPDNSYIELGSVNPYSRYLAMSYFTTAVGNNGEPFAAAAFRSIYFDGENLLVYKADRNAVDHVIPGIFAPADVMAALRRVIQKGMEMREQDITLESAGLDDWRIISVAGPWYERFDDFNIEIYRYNYECHTAAPEKVIWAGGLYVDEDGWVSPGYPDCDYIFFRTDPDGNRTYLFTMIENDCGPGSGEFRMDLERELIRMGFHASPGQEVQNVWQEIKAEESVVLSLQTPDTPDGMRYETVPEYYNLPGDLTESHTWEKLTKNQVRDFRNTSVLSVGIGDKNLTFYEDSRLVCCQYNGETSWYRSAYSGTADRGACELFQWFRWWYDELEAKDRYSQAVVPNDGRSREETARTWAEKYEKTMLDFTRGHRYKCLYVDVRDVTIDTTIQHYPKLCDGREAFAIRYRVVFVPEKYDFQWFNSCYEYEGTDAPKGAYQYTRLAYLYLDTDVWRTAGVGAGAD